MSKRVATTYIINQNGKEYYFNFKVENEGEDPKYFYHRNQADYYRKQNGGKIVSKYQVCDISKHMFADMPVYETISPIKAARLYVKENNLNLNVVPDNTNSGRLVVASNKNTRVYHLIEKSSRTKS